MNEFASILSTTKEQLSTAVAGTRRVSRVSEALAWNSGTQEAPQYHSIWQNEKFMVALGKPGKEAAPTYMLCRYKDGRKGNNPNDMKPSIFYKGIRQDKEVASFREIFDELQQLGNSNEEALELIACLLFRSAYLIDHIETAPGKWRYAPPEPVVEAIVKRLPIVEGKLPMEVFLHFLDSLAWNEDVKYHTLGFDIRLGYGRRNNLLTCVNLIGVLLRRVSISKFAGDFSRPPAGISAIAQSEALKVFPLLAANR